MIAIHEPEKMKRIAAKKNKKQKKQVQHDKTMVGPKMPQQNGQKKKVPPPPPRNNLTKLFESKAKVVNQPDFEEEDEPRDPF